ncbi:MAG: GNAT family N-acetyltransferase [bacterium]
MKYFKKLEGKNIYLSPINIDDAEKYTEWLNDLEVTINLTLSPNIYSVEKEREILKEMTEEGNNFAIIEKNNNQLIGNCGLLNVNLINRKAELGIFIGDKNYWNKGLGSEAICLLLDYSFNILNLNNIFLRVHEFNERAVNCYKKCGFKEIGRRREAYILGNKKYDIIFMDILAKEFEGEITDFLNKYQK